MKTISTPGLGFSGPAKSQRHVAAIVAICAICGLMFAGVASAAWTAKVLSVTYIQNKGVVRILLEVRKGDGTLYLGKYPFGVRADDVIEKANTEGITRQQALEKIVRGQIAILEEQETA